MSKKLIGIIAGSALVLSLVGGSAAQAAALSQAQISAIVSLLSSFGADATTIANVTASLNGQPTTTTTTTTTTSGYKFNTDLQFGSRGADVTALQNLLGISPATGYFGSLTKAAVIKYQGDHNITPAAGYFGPKTRAIVNASAGTVTTTGTVTTGTTSGTDLTVTLAPTSPAAGAVVAGQSIANLAEYTFTNTSATPAVVTNVTLQRGGVSNDAALTNIYLYNGVTRLTDAASISSGKITFNAPAGLFTVPAGSSMVVAVRSDILTGTTYNGQIFVISLTGVTSNLPVAAAYPISGANQTISSATLAGVAVASTSPSTTSIDPQTDYVLWQGTANVTNNDVWLKAIAFRQVGSVTSGDLNNFRFYVDGIQVGSTMNAYDANGYLTIDLSANPYLLKATNHTLKLIGDIIGGSTKTFSFSIRQASDINVVDSQLNVNVLSTAAATFPLTSGVQTINAGTLTISKAVDSPSGSVTLAQNGASLAKFTLKAAGEPVKVESMKVNWAGLTGASASGIIRNGALFMSTDGVNFAQIGSTADIASSTSAAVSTTYNLGSSLVVNPGTPVTLLVKGDIYSTTGAAFANGSTIQVSLVAGSSNGSLLRSLGTISTGAATANILTVQQGSLSLSKSSTYANQSVVAPQSLLKLGTYTLTAGTTEDLNINTVTINFLGAGASSSATSSITNVYFTFADKTSNVKQTIASGDNAYQVNYVLGAGKTAVINVYGTVASTIGAADKIVTKLQINGQTANSIQAVNVPSSTTYVTGQTISITTGALTPAFYGSLASSTVVAGSDSNNLKTVKVGSFKFTATGDNFAITQLVGSIPYASIGNVANVIYKVGNTVVNAGTPIDDDGSAIANATTTNLSMDGVNQGINVTTSAPVIIDAYLQLNPINSTNASSSKNITFTLKGYQQMSSTGVTSDLGTPIVGPVQYAYASVPTITLVPMTGSAIGDGTDKDLMHFSISADAAGAIDWDVIKFTVTKSTNVAIGNNTAANNGWSLYDNGSLVEGTFASSTDLASSTNGGTGGTVTFTATAPVTVAAGTTHQYILRSTIGGGTISGSSYSVVTSVEKGQATPAHIQSTSATLATSNASFVWSDNSFTNHGLTTPDWNNDTLIKNIPTGSQTLN